MKCIGSPNSKQFSIARYECSFNFCCEQRYLISHCIFEINQILKLKFNHTVITLADLSGSFVSLLLVRQANVSSLFIRVQLKLELYTVIPLANLGSAFFFLVLARVTMAN